MIVAAEWGSGQALWSTLWFFMFVIWVWMIIVIFSDIIRSADLSGGGKAIWSIFIIVLPFLGIFAYLIARGGSMADRSSAATKEANEASRAYLREAAAVSTDADQLAKLSEQHTAGKIDDAEYAAAKAAVIAR